MAFDGFVCKSIVCELNTCLIGGKIEKIYSPTENEILLSIYSSGLKYALNINISSNNYRVGLTTSAKANPLTPSNFCMVLRKHLLNSRISKIYSIDLERIVIIEFESFIEGTIETKKLIIELMGKHSNVILVDAADVIINSLRHLSVSNNSSRNILPKHNYCFPESSKANFLSINNFDDFFEMFNDKENISASLAELFTGFSKTFAQSCIRFTNISDIPTRENLSKVYGYISDITRNLNSMNLACSKFENDYCLMLKPKNSNLDINFFLDDYYTDKENIETFKDFQKSLLNIVLGNIKKDEIKLEKIESKLEECSNMEKYKLYGELITANLYKLKDIHSECINVLNYYDNTNIDIPLDKSISINDNAKAYFKKYNKLKSALDIVNNQKSELLSEVTYFESIVYSIQESKSLEDLNEIYQELSGSIIKSKGKKSRKTEKLKDKGKDKLSDPLKYIIDGFTVYVGKNNLQNEYLTHKLTVNSDYWFHVKNIHGSHLILKSEGKTPSIETINKCASIAAYYSKAKYSSNVPVDYTQIKNVKKLPKSNPGLVIYTNYSTVNVEPKLFEQ